VQPLLAAPREGLTEAQVRSAIANPSPQVRHGVTVLDSDLVETGEALPVDADAGGTVEWSYRPDQPGTAASATTDIRRIATLNLAGDVDDGLLLSRLFRIWTELRATDGVWVRFHLGVFSSTLPARSDDGTVVRRRLTLAPREQEWRARTLDDWQVVVAADDVLDTIRADLAAEFGITATAFPEPAGASTLGADMVFKTGTSYYEKFSRLLNGIAYDQPITDENGLPTAQPLDVLAGKGPEWTYAPGEGRIVVAGEVDPAEPDLPNVIRFQARTGPSLGPTEGNGLYTLRNQSTGPASIDQRGREVFRLVVVDAANQPELESFATAEFQRYVAGGGLRWTGRVGLNPLHSDRDVVQLVRPRLGLSGVWNVTSWTYPLRRMTGEDAALMQMSAELRVTPEEAP
jgi:hypothetical protein